MDTITFDTHAFVKKLEASGFEEKQAEVLSDAIKEVQETHLEELATKRDILELKRDIKELELRLKYDLTVRFGGMLAVTTGILAVLMKIL